MQMLYVRVKTSIAKSITLIGLLVSVVSKDIELGRMVDANTLINSVHTLIMKVSA